MAGGLVPPPRRRPRRARGGGRPRRQPARHLCADGALELSPRATCPTPRWCSASPTPWSPTTPTRPSTSCSPAGRCCTCCPRRRRQMVSRPAAASRVTYPPHEILPGPVCRRSRSWPPPWTPCSTTVDAEHRVAYQRAVALAFAHTDDLSGWRVVETDPPPVRRRLRAGPFSGPASTARYQAVDVPAVRVPVQQTATALVLDPLLIGGRGRKARSSAARRSATSRHTGPGTTSARSCSSPGERLSVVEVRREADDGPAGHREVGELAGVVGDQHGGRPAAPPRRRGSDGPTGRARRPTVGQVLRRVARDRTGDRRAHAEHGTLLGAATQTATAGRRVRSRGSAVSPAWACGREPQHEPAPGELAPQPVALLAQVGGQRRGLRQQEVGPGRPGHPDPLVGPGSNGARTACTVGQDDVTTA